MPFSKPLNKKVGKQTGGYDNRSISDDLISVIMLRFCNKTRTEESEEHMRSLGGEPHSSHGSMPDFCPLTNACSLAVTISVNTTFRYAYKATLVDKNKAHIKSHLSGFVSIINQKS